MWGLLHEESSGIVSTDGVITRRDYPVLIGTIDRLIRNGRLRAVLPGVYAQPEACESMATRVRALMRWDPDAILVSEVAAWAVVLAGDCVWRLIECSRQA